LFVWSQMTKVLIFYWEPGSGGDFVNRLLLERPLEYQIVQEKLTLSGQGRFIPNIKRFFVDQFGCDLNKWYFRTWTAEDCALLADLITDMKCPWFVIPTHRLDQVNMLKSQFKNSSSMGITYPDNMFPLVLKNWCKKVAAFDPAFQEIYNKPVHQYFRDNNRFGEFALSEQLSYGTRLKPCVNNTFDIGISLEDIYCSELSVLKSLFNDSEHVDHLVNDWLSCQSSMHSYCYDIPETLRKLLGHNAKSVLKGDLSVCLDTFDNTLIRHYFDKKNIPNFKTLQQAADFFNQYSTGG
jgi:hypothetical protein